MHLSAIPTAGIGLVGSHLRYPVRADCSRPTPWGGAMQQSGRTLCGHCCRTHLWTDSAYTANGTWQLQHDNHNLPYHTHTDLWRRLASTLADLDPEQFQVHHTLQTISPTQSMPGWHVGITQQTPLPRLPTSSEGSHFKTFGQLMKKLNSINFIASGTFRPSTSLLQRSRHQQLRRPQQMLNLTYLKTQILLLNTVRLR